MKPYAAKAADFVWRALPEQIQLGQIVRATEGDAPIVECLSGDPNACRINPSSCKLKGILAKVFEALYDSLDEHTLADLVETPRVLKQLLTHNSTWTPNIESTPATALIRIVSQPRVTHSARHLRLGECRVAVDSVDRPHCQLRRCRPRS